MINCRRIILLSSFLFIFAASCAQAAVVGSVSALDIAPNGDIWVAGAFTTEDNHNRNLTVIRRGSATIDPAFPGIVGNAMTGGINAIRSIGDGDFLVAFTSQVLNGRETRLARISPEGLVRSDFGVPYGKGAVSSDTISEIASDPMGGFIVDGLLNTLGLDPNRSHKVFASGRLDPEFDGFFGWPSRDGRIWRFYGSTFVVRDGNGDNGATNLNLTIGHSNYPRLLFRPDRRTLAFGWSFAPASGGASYSGLVQLLPDGQIDPSFQGNGALPKDSILAAALQPDGKLLVGGSFTNAFGRPAGRVVRLNVDGSFDESFPAAPGADAKVSAIAVSPDGLIWFGGTFTNFNSAASRGLASLPVSFSASSEQVGFAFTRIGCNENVTPQIEVLRIGSGVGEISATVRMEGIDPPIFIPVHFDAGDLLSKRFSIPTSLDNNTDDGDRSLTCTLENPLGATLVPNAAQCEIRIFDDETGLTSEYYLLPSAARNNQNLTTVNTFGSLALRRQDACINFNWGEQPPVSQITNSEFSAVFRGYFIPDVTGIHTFQIQLDDAARLWIGGNLLLDLWPSTSSTVQNAKSITLSAGQRYPIELQFVNYIYHSSCRLTLKEYPLRRRHFRLATPDQGIPPSASLSAANTTVSPGSSSRFLLDLKGSPPISVQWFKDGVAIPGGTNLILTLSPAASGQYSFNASNAWGVLTNHGNLIVASKPSNLSAPFSQVSQIGENVQFNASASGTSPLSFVWSRSGVPLLTNTSGILALNTISPGDAALFSVFAANTWGSSATSSFRLYVLDHAPEPATVAISSDLSGTVDLHTDPALRFILESSADLSKWSPRTNLVTNGSLSLPLSGLVNPGSNQFFRLTLTQ